MHQTLRSHLESYYSEGVVSAICRTRQALLEAENALNARLNYAPEPAPEIEYTTSLSAYYLAECNQYLERAEAALAAAPKPSASTEEVQKSTDINNYTPNVFEYVTPTQTNIMSTDIEFEKWKITFIENQKMHRLTTQHEHEFKMCKFKQAHELEALKIQLEIEQHRSASRQVSAPRAQKTTTPEFTEEDEEFNKTSLYMLGKPSTVGKLSISKCQSDSKTLAEPLAGKFSSMSAYKHLYERFDKEDLKKGRVSTLIHQLLYVSAASSRLERWPDCKDADYADKVKTDVLQKLETYSPKALHLTIEFLNAAWSSLICESTSLNLSLIQEYLDEKIPPFLEHEEGAEEVRIKNHPLLKAYIERLKQDYPIENEDEFWRWAAFQKMTSLSCKSTLVHWHATKCYQNYVPHHLKDQYTIEQWIKTEGWRGLAYDLNKYNTTIIAELNTPEMQKRSDDFFAKRHAMGKTREIW